MYGWGSASLRIFFVVIGFFEQFCPLFVRTRLRIIFASAHEKVGYRFPQQTLIDLFTTNIALDDRYMVIVLDDGHDHK